MSTIKGGGDFPLHKPIHGQAPKLAKAEPVNSPFNTTDGLVLSGSGLKETPDQSQISGQPEVGSLAKGLRDVEANHGKPINLIEFETCLMAQVDGQFLSGPGVGKMQTTGIVLDPSSSGGVSEFAFTNGLNSRQLVSLNGQVLADANPFK
ncbi:hypothetical protein IV102_24310 [bacterium]|nr:hypothetical protein [bacterium]